MNTLTRSNPTRANDAVACAEDLVTELACMGDCGKEDDITIEAVATWIESFLGAAVVDLRACAKENLASPSGQQAPKGASHVLDCDACWAATLCEVETRMVAADIIQLRRGDLGTKSRVCGNVFHRDKSDLLAQVEEAYTVLRSRSGGSQRDDYGSLGRKPEYDPDLSAELEQKFGTFGLHRAYVVRFSNMPSAPELRSDYIHSELAKAAARDLEEILSIDLVFGVGSGRGAGYTCDEVARRVSIRPSYAWPHNMRIVPLTGHIAASDWTGKQLHTDRYYDAWYAADRLTNVCWHSVVHRVQLPFVLPDGLVKPVASNDDTLDSAQRFAEEHQLPIALSLWRREAEERRHDIRPQVCIVGLGVVEGGHRLVRPEAQEEVRPIAPSLRRLLDLISSGRCIVGDLCNQLFLVKCDEDCADTAQLLVRKINDRLLTVTREHFDYVETVYMVAGGKEKVEVLRTVLTSPMKSMRRLYVDADCAQELLNTQESIPT